MLAHPKFAWPFDWPTHMKIPRTAPVRDKQVGELSQRTDEDKQTQSRVPKFQLF